MSTRGQMGLPGCPGPKGCDGKRGKRGKDGPTGPAGSSVSGFTGPTGPQGEQGLLGPTGANGLQGATGVTGPQGQTGATGDTGPQGQTGATGVTGPQGQTGATGLQGNTGATGPAGGVTTVNSGVGLTGGPITTTGTLNVALPIGLFYYVGAQQGGIGAGAPIPVNTATQSNGGVGSLAGGIVTLSSTGVYQVSCAASNVGGLIRLQLIKDGGAVAYSQNSTGGDPANITTYIVSLLAGTTINMTTLDGLTIEDSSVGGIRNYILITRIA